MATLRVPVLLDGGALADTHDPAVFAPSSRSGRLGSRARAMHLLRNARRPCPRWSRPVAFGASTSMSKADCSDVCGYVQGAFGNWVRVCWEECCFTCRPTWKCAFAVTRNRLAGVGPDKRMVTVAISRRGFLARAWQAGVGVGGLVLAGCGGPEVFNARREDAAEGAQEESAPLASPLAAGASEQAETAAVAVADGEQEEGRQAQEQVRAVREPVTVPIVERPVPNDVVDPLVWRERYHWRELAKLPGQEAGPVRGGGLFLHAQSQISWTPFGPQLQAGRVGTFLPLVYSQLVVMASGDHRDAHHGEIEGDLAVSWEVPEPTTLVFRIRGDVRWPDSEPLSGRMLTASDVRISHDAYLSSELPQGSAYGAVERIEADDGEMTVAFGLSEPASYLPAEMTGPLHVIAPPHQLEDPSAALTFDRTGTGRSVTPEGTGPFRLEFTSVASWGMRRNPSYFKRDQVTGERLPYLARIRGGVLISRRPMSYNRPSRDEVWQDWKDQRFDVLELIRPSELEKSLAMFPGVAAQVLAPTPGLGSALFFRGIQGGPLADARVRLALSASIDRVEIARRVHHGLAAPDCGHDWTHVVDDASESGFREWPWTPEELGESHVFDPERARALLSAAGYGAEQPLVINLDAGESGRLALSVNPNEVATVAHQWQTHLGEAAEVRLLPRSIRIVGSGRSEISISDLHEDARILATAYLPRYAADPDGITYGRLHSSANPLVGDAVLDDLCERQRGELDAVRRSELLEQIRVRDLELGWRLTLVNPYGLVARQGDVFNVGGTHIAHRFDLNPKQFERAWRLPG